VVQSSGSRDSACEAWDLEAGSWLWRKGEKTSAVALHGHAVTLTWMAGFAGGEG
jgi:hypothetical protein